MSKAHILAIALAAILLLAAGGPAQAHKPLLAVEDNNDGTIYIEAGFSDGSSAAGHKILLKAKGTGKLLSEHRVGEDGTLEVKKPAEEFTVTLDAGEGHKVTQDGPPPAKADKAAPEKAGTEAKAPAPQPSQPQAAPPSPVVEKKPAQQPPSATPPLGRSVAMPGPPGPSSVAMGPGALMAFKMMMLTQIITAVALIVLLVIVAYYLGYRMGRNSVA